MLFYHQIQHTANVVFLSYLESHSYEDKERRAAVKPLSSLTTMPLLGCFGKQNDALVGWSDAISANPLMDLEPDQARLGLLVKSKVLIALCILMDIFLPLPTPGHSKRNHNSIHLHRGVSIDQI